MRRNFEELRENLAEFVEQTEYPFLVVGCLSEELAYVLQFLQSLEGEHPEHFFISFPQTFSTPHDYVQAVFEALRLQIEAAGPLRAARGEPPFPAPPQELGNAALPAQQRLRAILQYLWSLLPAELEHCVVVGLLPLRCIDINAYATLMGSLLPIAKLEPWLERLRIVVYDDRSRHLLTNAMRARQVEHVLTCEVDFSTPTLTSALTRDAADTSLPVPERMGYLLQLAALDYSYKRYPDALEKYGVLHEFYEAQNLPSMQALCLLGTGDVMRAGGRPAAAKEMLQRGIALAMQHQVLPVLLNLLISTVGVCFELRHHEDAESYADSGARVAAAAMNPFAYADMYERKADAQLAQGKLLPALLTYKRCEELCQLYVYIERWKSVLTKQIEVFAREQMNRERRTAEHELALVEQRERGVAQPAATPAARLGPRRDRSA